MKGKSGRQSHKATNTHVFKGFGEKVRTLRISARKYLLQRPTTDEGEETTFLHEAIKKSNELNVTDQFKTFVKELGCQVYTLNQLVHHEEHVANCLMTHLSIPNSLALEPLFKVLVSFASDLPQEFYKKHFYVFLSKLTAHLKTKEPEQIEAVFLCIVSLFVVLQKYLQEDLYELYHVQNYAALLSKSYPWYVNELAAQCLVVLVRKMPQKDEFIGMTFRKLKKDETQVQGLGRVFASLMKSDVIQRMHSCTPKILGKLLEVLSSDDYEIPQPLALETVKFAASLVSCHITTHHQDTAASWQSHWKEDGSMVWRTLWNCIKDLLSGSSVENNYSQLNSILQVVGVFVSHKYGVLVSDMNDVVTNCLSVLESPVPDEVGVTLIEILTVILAMSQDKVSPCMLKKIVSSFLSSSFTPSVKIDFVKQSIDFSRFDYEILPLILPYLDNLMGSSKDPCLLKDILELIAAITVSKRPPCSIGMELEVWNAYPLNFSSGSLVKETHVGCYIKKKVKEGIVKDLSNFEDLCLLLVCIPHVVLLNDKELACSLKCILNDSMALLKDDAQKIVDCDRPSAPKKRKSDVPTSIQGVEIDLNVKSSIPLQTRKVLFLISLIVEVMAHVSSNQDFLEILNQLELLELLKKKHHYRENVHLLRAVDLHFTVASVEKENRVINEENLGEIYSFLAPSLSSSDPQVRLLVLHIFSLFPVALPPVPENTETVESLFQILLKAECLPLTPFELRDRLRFITMVDAEHVKPHCPVSGKFNQAPLLFLIGQLYTNFKDIWNPVINAIAGFAQSLPGEVFWPIWFSKLKIASHVTQEVLKRQEVDADVDLHVTSSVLSDVSDRLSLHSGYSKLTSKLDHLNFRDLLWKAMEKFPDVCEAKNRDVVPLFFDFLEKEFFPVDFTVSPTQDIRAAVSELNKDESKLASQSENEKMDVDEDNVITNGLDVIEEDDDTAGYPRRASVKSLCLHLMVFSKFRNPKMLTQSKKLETMYLELLTHPSPSLQKFSFDCLLTYSHSYLTPYKDHMYKLLDDKTFKSSLTLFSIDGEETSLEDSHRKEFMPYLMRILYGKMHFKTGSNSSGKNKINIRKALILRFLAGAREEEFQTFIELAFDVILCHIEGSVPDIITKSREALDLKCVIPLKRLLGALNTMDNIIEKIANKMTVNRSLLLKVILYIVNVSSLILNRRSEIKKRYVTFLRHIRQQAHRQIVSFFTLLEDYPWQEDEINAVFDTMVWPNLARLPGEGISSCVPLLSLFKCWSENPRYFPLLAKVHKDDPTLTPLAYIVKLVANEKCHVVVRTAIFDMVEKLLTLEDHNEKEPDEEGRLLPLIVCPPVVEVKRLDSRQGSGQQNYGSALLVPYLEDLLWTMKTLITNLGKGMKVKQRDLNILTSLTEWVTSKGISEELLNLIIPLVVKKNVKSKETVAQLIKTCSHLLCVVDESKQFLRPLISQLGCLEDRASRDALCEALASVASANSECRDIANLAADLNAWNPKMVDEVDYDRRLDAYKKLTEYCTNAVTIDLDYCQFIVYSNMFVICHVDDSSLRDMSRLSLDQLIDMCVRLQPTHTAEFKIVMIDKFLTQVRNGLRHRKEEVRQDIIFLLQKIVCKCHAFYDGLEDLYKLADEEEIETDFYTNMMHIQRHRRSRALMRLANKLKNGSLVLTTETITNYLLPLVKVYLFNQIYAKDDYLVQSSAQCLGSFALVLPWQPYLKLLTTYMNTFKKVDMKYHKLAVKVLELVIQGFHEEFEDIKVFEGKGKVTVKRGKRFRAQPKKRNSKAGQNAMKKSSDDQNYEKKANDDGLVKDIVMEEFEVKEESDHTETIGKEVEYADKPITISDEDLSKRQKVYLALVTRIIPNLKRILVAKTKADKTHKVNQSKYPEDEEIKRIPLAFALIKLMKKLPSKVLDNNVSIILLKVIGFLKCQLHPIREEAREMLIKIMLELGGNYLAVLVSDMRSILTRGFQTHVLVFTLHSVLSQMRSMLTGDDVDACVVDMVDICKSDILGMQAEEKKVMKIATKVKEARHEKSYAILNFAAEFVSAASIGELMVPMKEVLATTVDKKIVNKMVRCLDDVASGLERNETIGITQKSVFIYGIVNEKLSQLTGKEKQTKEDKKDKIQRPDSYLLAPEPKRTKLTPNTSLQTTSHVFIEFALKLLASLMRRSKFNSEDADHIKLLDPYVGALTKCISSEYPDISVHALKCINLMVKYPLPTLKTEISNVCSEMFVILHKFSSSELTKGKIFELVQLTFKSLAFIIKSVDYYNVSPEQVRVLLQYVQESLENSNHQAPMFAVLQSILGRKIDAPELHELMDIVKKTSITSNRQFALNQARITYYSYLLTYPMKKNRIVSEVRYFLSNVAYSSEEGRLSAQMFINGVVTNFPMKFISKDLETLLWLKLSEQILREEMKENRNWLHKSLKTLFERTPRKLELIDLCLKLFGEDATENLESKAVALQLGLRSMNAFLDIPVTKLPKNFLSVVGPKIVSLVNPSRFKTQMMENDEPSDVECSHNIQDVDNAVIVLLEVLSKLVTLFIQNPSWEKHIDESIWNNVQSFLFYPHIKVRLGAVTLIGQLLAANPVDDKRVPVLCSTTLKARSLALDLCEILQTRGEADFAVMTQLSLSVVRNLIYLVRNACRVSLLKVKEVSDDAVDESLEDREEGLSKVEEEEEKDATVCSALWLMRRVGDMAYKELHVSGRDYTIIREALLNLMAGVIVILGEKVHSPDLLSYIIKHLAREMSDKKNPEKLINRTQEVANLVKELIGLQLYTRQFTAAQVSLSKKRLERKAQDKQQRLLNPTIFEKKKEKKRLAGKFSKKLKRDKSKGKIISDSKVAKMKKEKKGMVIGKSKISKLRANAILAE